MWGLSQRVNHTAAKRMALTEEKAGFVNLYIKSFVFRVCKEMD